MLFPPTNWTQLREATLNGGGAGREALETMCRDYRPPVVAFLRQRGYDGHEAEDLTQHLFLELLEKHAWRRADQSKGRFRTFLLGVLMFVLSRERRRANAGKRGLGVVPLSLEGRAEQGEEVAAEPEATGQFDRQWALQLVAVALAAVGQGLQAHGRPGDWPVLVRFLPGAGEVPSYEAAAAALGLSLPALKTAVSRLRQQFRTELRRAVARTVGAPHEIDEELAYLREVLTQVI